jgi:Tetratricopeptide repeat
VPAEERYRAALEQLGRVLGPDHPSSLVCAANLAVLQRESGHADEAARRGYEILGAMTARLGSRHPRTAALRDWRRSTRTGPAPGLTRSVDDGGRYGRHRLVVGGGHRFRSRPGVWQDARDGYGGTPVRVEGPKSGAGPPL